RSVASRYLHSFPTRRSSDLALIGPMALPSHGAENRCRFVLSGRQRASHADDMMERFTATYCSTPQLAAGSRFRRGGVETSAAARSEEHTSELQSRENLVCRL